MEYRKLGSTGLEVSRLCLGCMSFGPPAEPTKPWQLIWPWTLDEMDASQVIRHALESGINFFDTANVYSAGASEVIVGRALAKYAQRDEIVLATKVFGRMSDGPNGAGLSRKAILAEIDNSLRRLGVDYVDLYQIHRFDPDTPVEETLEALHDVVRAGKTRYIGASSMYAWQFAKMLHTAELHSWAQFATMQDHYNLLYREEEREMLPLCADQGVGVITWSPFARGRLTRDWDQTTLRSKTDDEPAKHLYVDQDRPIVELVGEVAAQRHAKRAQVALAWLLSKPVVTAPIIGVTRIGQLDDALGALTLELSPDEISRLETPYEPHRISGH